MEQMFFRDLMFFARNDFAMPEIEGCKREFAVNSAVLIRNKISKEQRRDLYKRQFWLLRRIRQINWERQR